MTTTPYPTDLTDAAWDLIKDLIPPPKPGGRHRELDRRAVVNALFYVVDGGIKWRMLPHEYPKWQSVYWYFRQWRDSGACKKLRLIWVDGTYRGQLVEWVSQHLRFVLRVTLRPEGAKGFVLLPRRWVVERTLAWLNQSRRLSKDYERLPQSSEAMIYLSMTRLMLRRLAAA